MTFHQPPYPDADNGNMPPADLTTVGSGLQLQKDVAVAWNAEVARAAAVGVSLTIPAGGAYRDYAAQLALYDSPRKGIAVPGTSTHGYGTCVDINTTSANNWAVANFEPSLWVRDLWNPITNGSPTPQNYLYEWNHWHYTGAIGATTTPPPALPKENNMTLAIAISLRVGVGQFYLFASPTQVSLSRELSTLSAADRSFEDGVMRAVALVSGYPSGYTPPLLDDSPNGGWYLRNQVASRVAGMPADFALSPTNPYSSP